MEIRGYPQYRQPADSPPETAFSSSYILSYPLIDMEVERHGTVTPTFAALVDSGAAFCVFYRDVASWLGISITSGRLKYIQGLSGMVSAYFFDVQLLIGTVTVNCYAGFIDQAPPSTYLGLLGNYDFLDKIPVELDAPGGEIRIG
jgi:hypothetical protein